MSTTQDDPEGTATTDNRHLNRHSLPIPTPPHVGVNTYDAKDPEGSYAAEDLDHLITPEVRLRLAMARQ